MFDQEPVCLPTYYNTTREYALNHSDFFHSNTNIKNYDYIFMFSKAIHVPILCHSEKNSKDVSVFENNFYVPLHYWWHGLVARYWFYSYKHLQNVYNEHKQRFGIYIRDASNIRKYRIDILQELSDINNQVFYQITPAMRTQITDINKKSILSKWPVSRADIHSSASATIDWADTNIYDIQLVAETLFHTEKIHLTEKSIKPIVMEQPFILFAGPNSLQYLRDYGFKTFSSLWDESYDIELDSKKRFVKIIDLIHNLSTLSKVEFKRLISKANTIVKYNKQHFYSQRFEDMLLSEFYNNLDSALDVRKEKFYTMPGGTLLHYNNMLHQQGLQLNKREINDFISIMNYMKTKHPLVAKEIVKKYSHLF
jgi:hypothetical protein